MQAVLQQIWGEVRDAWRFRWFAMVAAWVICMIGWTAILFVPDTYEASARVFVDTRTALSQITQGIAVESTVDNQIQRIRQALLGGPQLEKVAREAQLDTDAITPQKRQALVAKLRNRIQITGGLSRESATAGVYVISFQDRDRERTLRVVDRLLNTFVEGALGGKREGSEQAQRFLVDQIAELERRLATAEEKLAEFKKLNVGMMPGAQGDYFTRLQAEMESMTKTQAALRVATQRRDEIARQLRGEQPYQASQSNSGGGSLSTGNDDTASRIRETQARLDETLLRFTDKHPDVIALRGTLNELMARQTAEIEAMRNGDVGAAARSGMSANPVFQAIQLQLNQADQDAAALRAEISDHQARISELRKLVDTAPGVEAEFKRLNRDYDVTRAQHQALVERLGRARFSEDADQTGVVRFEVIDPPTAAFSPVAPNRPLMIFAVLIVGIGAGGVLAYLLHQLKPVFNTAKQLSEMTGLPVLGVVSMTWLEKHQARERKGIFTFVGAIAALVVLAVTVLVVHGRAIQFVHDLVA